MDSKRDGDDLGGSLLLQTIECPVCMDVYGEDSDREKVPKILPCGHSLCQGCCSRLECHQCPLCKAEIPWVEDVPTNFTALEIIEALRINGKLEELSAPEPPARVGRRKFQIFVRDLSGKSLAFDVRLRDTIGELKSRIQARLGIPPSEQRLIYAGKQLADESLVAEYKIEKGSTVQIVMRLLGGQCREGMGYAPMDERLFALSFEISSATSAREHTSCPQPGGSNARGLRPTGPPTGGWRGWASSSSPRRRSSSSILDPDVQASFLRLRGKTLAFVLFVYAAVGLCAFVHRLGTSL